MSYSFTRECDDGPAISPHYELSVIYEVEQGQIAVRGVYVQFAGSHTDARLGDRNYDREAIKAMCREHLEAVQ
ncbi:hypothetical protein [Cupriavidus gilardii]|uniref:hypothetical protein n=1 Tax=Cupriavidus gilardii TaxID=82541 RepID=UPI0015732A70|nr:hypothetical protein [Cupriavidus gilardii]NSX06046.1 hypothetical protein [Cupriavidus gilardii]